MNEKFIEYLEQIPNRGSKLDRFLQIVKEIRDENRVPQSTHSFLILGHPMVVPNLLTPVQEKYYDVIIHIVNGGKIRELPMISSNEQRAFFALKLFCNSRGLD